MKPLFILLSLLICFSLVGCSSSSQRPTAKLSGKVLLDGKPLEAGTVVVLSEDGKFQDRGSIKEGGAYAVTAPVGTAKIAVELPPGAKIPPGMERLKEKELIAMMVKEKLIPDDLPPEVQKAMVAAGKVPVPFQNPGTSGIRTTVAEGENTFDIKLPSKIPGPK